MELTPPVLVDGVREQSFVVGDVPGVLWSPDSTPSRATDTTRPLVLMGHGGGQHKRSPGVLARAHRYVTGSGFVVAAIDAPGHGERPRTAEDEALFAGLQRLRAAGKSIGPLIATDQATRASRMAAEWRAVLNALQDLDQIGAGGLVGYWGLSLGGAVGLHLVADEPRVDAAVLGLVGSEALVEVARAVTAPMQMVAQWDDELVPRPSALALFEALASPQKTLHAHPGGHLAVPRFEVDDSHLFFRRHLLGGDDGSAAG